MRYFKFAHNQSEKGMGKTFLYAIILGLIFAVSILVTLLKGMSNFDERELKDFANETGCILVDYKLQCDSDYYEYEGVVIDLNYEDSNDYQDVIILTKQRIYTQDQSFTYEQALDVFGHSGGDLNVDDVINIFYDFQTIILVVGFIGSLIGSTIFFLVGNTLLAAVMILIFKGYKYGQMYKLIMLTIAPFVLFNAITRMIFDATLIGQLTSYIPYVGWILHITLDYAIIYGLTYLAVIEGKKLQPIGEEEVIENKVW